MPSYNNNIPQATDQLSASQGQILTNFGTIDTVFKVNHVELAAATNYGKHFFVEFPVQSSIPTTAAAEVGLYCQLSNSTSQPELVFAHQMGSTAPATAQIVEFTSAGWTTVGWTRLPSGILLKWGNGVAANANQVYTYTFPVDTTAGSAIPAYSSIYSIQLTCATGNTTQNEAIMLGTYTTTTFNVFIRKLIGSPPTNVPFTYLAIGV